MEIMNQTSNAEGRRAFTVIELLVVILIIGILVGFSFPPIRSMALAALLVPICSTVCVPSRLVPMHL